MVKHFKAIERFVKDESFSGILLFLATVAALIVANSSFGESYFKLWNTPLGVTVGSHTISMDLMHWINDGLMALFFLMVGLEIKRELLIGELSSIKKASFPIVAAIGGMIIPALIYIAFNSDNPKGFGIPMATDIAFALGILMLLGKKVNPSLKLFLVALAVVDDLGAVIVVATVYTNEIHTEYFLYVAVTYLLIWLLNIRRVTMLLPYLLLGIALWIFIHSAGVHATIAGVLLAFAIPISSKVDEKEFIKNTRESVNIFEKHIDTIPILNHHQIDALEDIAYNYDKVQNPLVKLEHQLHGLSAFVIMPLFAFSNAGVMLNFSAISENLLIVLGVLFGLVIGKPIGIVGFTYLANKLKIAQKPDDLKWSEIVAVGFLGGIGFTMSIFITQLAFLDQNIIDAVKLGIFFASFIAGLIGVLLILRSYKTN
ncbi:Na+/H+ antiporter NhaA [Hydrogenimonas thermophila]|uniref:Na+/H+ antiporter NhaA n=1 Tax=Hydrogenimonas thermophila TaxID=223786 RepID=UPI0029373954|nr:Na+/H+ antiporter NhaA [Hydrogenimonas thermophila]WOE70752.1 Na+/H+ antiporter NhaA [Hydrogenimonas thermophila]WOE73270.1 Na+/H+ antiporter NhaA [Hydrogenimonas thermophila]